MKLTCFTCGATVSSELPEDTVLRGTVECPECTEAKLPEIARLERRFLEETANHDKTRKRLESRERELERIRSNNYKDRVEETVGLTKLKEFAKSIRDNWDCDADAHRHGTPCRCCEAEELLK
jgi:hypothetical protein